MNTTLAILAVAHSRANAALLQAKRAAEQVAPLAHLDVVKDLALSLKLAVADLERIERKFMSLVEQARLEAVLP